jgi:hypothetical protein
MTLQRWIDSRNPAPPPALAACMRPALDSAAAAGVRRLDEGALDAALAIADSVLRDASGARTGAIALLAADALVTYAFEAAAEHPEHLEALAESAMVRIAAAAERAG